MMLKLKEQPIIQMMNGHLMDYPTPSNLSYLWNFGFLSGLCLGIQIVTGIALAMHYTPHVDLAFLSVEHMMRDVNGGWLLRYIHANGASMFFIVVYMHIGRGLYYGSYLAPSAFVWILGVVILLLMMATAFMGYVLPWGQMSFWGATVMTNLFSAFPLVGSKMVTLLWGGFSVDNATLNSFFSLHYLLPFLIAGAVIIHMAAVHQDGSNNPLGMSSMTDKMSFFPYFVLKDLLGFMPFLIFFSFFVFFYPNVLGHSDNYIEANPMVTPEHIVPEWYFLPSYAMLSSMPNKLLGVLALFASILVLMLLPFINTSNYSSSLYSPIHQFFFFWMIANFMLLGYIGQQTPETPFMEMGQVASMYYFTYFLMMIPGLGYIESKLLSL